MKQTGWILIGVFIGIGALLAIQATRAKQAQVTPKSHIDSLKTKYHLDY